MKGTRMKITFLGGTETVTGSKYLLSFENNKNILVDCGLFQGYKELRLRNWKPLPFNPKDIHAVILTHAHIDHTGYLPLLVKNGFKGIIYCTQGTKDLCNILLPDSAHLQEEDARQANKHGYSKHRPALPLYTVDDAKAALNLFKPLPYATEFPLFQDTSFHLIRSGHIIGSSFVKIRNKGKSLLFTGDMGRLHDEVMRPPEFIDHVDFLVMESTYGNRLHEKENPKELIKNVINKTINRGGSVIIPAFAVGRAQTILYYLSELKKENGIPDIPVYLDSPMAINATNILCNHKDDHYLQDTQCKNLCGVAKYVNTPQESMEIDQDQKPKIIISASGMATGGRILFHLKTYGPDAKNTILFTGYQAGGTRGANLLAGNKETRIHGELITVKADIEEITNTSAHADYEELLEWLKHFKNPPKKIFITHGETEASLSLKGKIVDQLKMNAVVPHYNQTEILT